MSQDGAEKLSPQESLSLGEVVARAFRELGETFVAFAKAPRALWGVNIPYVLEGLVYFGILTILGKYCSENVQLSDLHAGWVYTGLTGGITLAMLFLGGVSDKIGVRKALILAFLAFIVGRGLIAVSGTFSLGHGVLSPMFFTMALGLLITLLAYGLYQPAAYAGVKRYTNPKTAAMGYSVIYGLMNLGAFFSGFVSPMVRHRFENVFPPNGLTAVFWTYTLLCVGSLLITLLILTKKTDRLAVERIQREAGEMEAPEEKNNEKPQPDNPTQRAPINQMPLIGLLTVVGVFLVLALLTHGGVIDAWMSVPVRSRVLRMPWPWLGVLAFGAAAVVEFLRVRPDHPFRDARFTFFIFILIPVQTLFAHNWLTLPYYLDRAFRGSVVSHYFEFFSNINPILIFVLAPLVAGLTSRANVYKMMIAGTLVMAAPTFLLALGPMVIPFLVYVLLMSIGEAMWQPRFLQWIAEIAPPDKTVLYMGIGQFPWFLTKFGTGLYSGYFVEHYIPRPETGLPMNTGVMWLIYACIAMISPVALILARNWMAKGMMKKHGT